jgi:hypothetical protein
VGVIAVEHEAESEVPSEVAPRDVGTVELAAAVEAPHLSVDELAPIPVVAPAIRRKAPPDPHELVRQARKALVDDQPAQALELLGRIPGSSPTLRGERVATEVAALCRLDRGAEAQELVEAFALAEPSSPLLARLDSACW